MKPVTSSPYNPTLYTLLGGKTLVARVNEVSFLGI